MVPWANIKNGYSGFERLATEYVSKEFQFPHGIWKHTRETRDGNKDAYTIIIGYHPYAEQDETWWMEAKYSTSETQKYLTRFRLDATIVSSIFHKKVSKIIFVTNIDVHSKTISDIRVALQRAIGCKEVYFSTGPLLEYWLLQNPDVFGMYFPGQPLPDGTRESLLVSEDINVYPYPSDRGYIEKCTHIYPGKTYQAYFKVISARQRRITISQAQTGVKLEDRELLLPLGETAVRIRFQLADRFRGCQIDKDGRERWKLELFKLDKKYPVLLKNPVEVLPKTDMHLVVRSQEEALKGLLIAAKQFCRAPGLKLSVLHGESGTGKSHLVHRLMGDRVLRGELIYYYNFLEDSVENAKRMLYLVFFLLLPYVNPDEITPEYLGEIGDDTEITKDLLTLAGYTNFPQELQQAFQRHCARRGSLLPERCEFAPRYLLLDNVQNLNAYLLEFLKSLLREVWQKGCHCFFLLAGQNHFLESGFYRDIRQTYEVTEYICKLDSADIIANIRLTTSFDLKSYSEVVGDYFPNLIVLISFLKFIRLSSAAEFHSLNDFLTLYIAFVNGGMSEALVLDQFKSTLADEDVKTVCFAVYTAPNGILFDTNNRRGASALLQNGLVKFNEQNRLIPFHDIYEGIFRRAYRISKQELGLAYTDALDEARDRLLFPSSPSDIAREVELVTQLRKAGRFYSVCYILDSFFEAPEAGRFAGALKSPLYAEPYYQMYFDYAYAAVNCSRHRTGYDDFEVIYAAIENRTSVKMRRLKLELLFELMNSNYNILHFREAMQRYRQFQNTMCLLMRAGELPSCPTDSEMYVLCENMRILVQSSRGKKKSEQMFLRWRDILKALPYPHQYIDFHVRYAHTLYTIDPGRALRYTQEANACLSEEGKGTSKLWCLVRFQYLYLRLLIHRDYTLLPELEELAEAAKRDYYSSYRHRNLALCAILYVLGDTQKADERFLQDMSHPRRLRDKLRGFYFETLAMHCLAHEDLPGASDALDRAAETFQHAPGYLRTIRHNQKVLRRALFSPKRMDYNLGGPLLRDWYYVDPRAD